MRGLLTILCLALMTRPAAAQTAAPVASPAAPFVGKLIVNVTLITEGQPTDDPALNELVETRAGQPLSMVEVRETLTHLFSLSRFEDVQVEATDVAGGVQLRYNLVPLHNVWRVQFAGKLGISEDLLRKRVTDRFGALPAIGRAPEVARVIEQQVYREHGYLRPTVHWRQTVQHHPDRTILTFDIDAGPHARIGRVDLAGDPLEPKDTFLQSIRAVAGTPYEPAVMQQRLEAYVQRMRKKRRYQAVANFVAQPSPDGAAVDLSVDVQAGPIVAVAFEGDPAGSLKLADLVPVEREGSADEDLIEDSARRITALLNQQGYWKASVTPERKEAPDSLTVVFTIHKGLSYRVGELGVSVVGNATVPIEQLRPFIVKLQPGDIFIESNLQAAVNAVKGVYLGLGYASVKVDGPASELDPAPGGQGLVRPAIVIVEGPRTVFGEIGFEGNANIPADQLRAVIKSVPGESYSVPQVIEDREAVLVEYLNAGFTQAEVNGKPAISPDRTRADLTFQIVEGQRMVVGHILIVGNTRTDRRVIERELLIKPGLPLGLEDVIESQRKLSALGLFRRVRVSVLSHGTGGTRDVIVTVEETAPNTISYGGGLEAGKELVQDEAGLASEQIEFAPRGFFDVGRRNLGGKNRSVNLYTRVSVRPQDKPEDPSRDGTGYGFGDYRVVGTYREPRALGAAADLTVTGAVEQGVRTSFNFVRKGVNAEVSHRLLPGVRLNGRYSFSTTRTFDERLTEEEQATIDRLFPEVRLSSFAGAIARDTRDDLLDPSRGMFLSAEATIAARALGGEVGFLKPYTQGLWFRRLPGKRRLVFAGRAALGLADGFPRTFEGEIVDDIPASERFFAGGGSTIRGFKLDTVGTPETITPKGFPKGGNAVIILNGELRVPVWGDFGTALFVDGGNVFARVTDFDIGELSGAVGFGLRYKSPIGPVRLDVGFKMERRVLAGTLEPRREIHLSIGQSF